MGAAPSGHDPQTEEFQAGIEIPIVVQQGIAIFDATGGDHGVDRLANGRLAFAQQAEIPGGVNRDFFASQPHCRRRAKHSLRVVEVALVVEPYKNFGKNQAADRRRLPAPPPRRRARASTRPQ